MRSCTPLVPETMLLMSYIFGAPRESTISLSLSLSTYLPFSLSSPDTLSRFSVIWRCSEDANVVVLPCATVKFTTLTPT